MTAKSTRATLLALTFATAALPGAARADWEWTRWGMTPREVVAASHGQVMPVPEKEQLRHTYRKGLAAGKIPELMTRSRMGDAEYVAYLLFDADSDRLVCVDLIPAATAHVAEQKKVLLTSLGSPNSETREKLPGLEWTTTIWTTPKEMVLLQEGRLGEKIQYCQR